MRLRCVLLRTPALVDSFLALDMLRRYEVTWRRVVNSRASLLQQAHDEPLDDDEDDDEEEDEEELEEEELLLLEDVDEESIDRR